MAIKVEGYTRKTKSGKMIQIKPYQRAGQAARPEQTLSTVRSRKGAGEALLDKKAALAAPTAAPMSLADKESAAKDLIAKITSPTTIEWTKSSSEKIENALSKPKAKVRTEDGRVMTSAKYKKLTKAAKGVTTKKESVKERMDRTLAEQAKQKAEAAREKAEAARASLGQEAIRKHAEKKVPSESGKERKARISREREEAIEKKREDAAAVRRQEQSIAESRRKEKEAMAKKEERRAAQEGASEAAEREFARSAAERKAKRASEFAVSEKLRTAAEAKASAVEAAKEAANTGKENKSFLRKVAEYPFKHIRDTFMESYENERERIHQNRLATNPAYRRRFRQQMEQERAQKASAATVEKATRAAEKAMRAYEAEQRKAEHKARTAGEKAYETTVTKQQKRRERGAELEQRRRRKFGEKI